MEFRFTCLDPFPRKTGSKNTRLDLNSRGFGPEQKVRFGISVHVLRLPGLVLLNPATEPVQKNSEKTAGLESRAAGKRCPAIWCRVWKFVHALSRKIYGKIVGKNLREKRRVSSHWPRVSSAPPYGVVFGNSSTHFLATTELRFAAGFESLAAGSGTPGLGVVF